MAGGLLDGEWFEPALSGPLPHQVGWKERMARIAAQALQPVPEGTWDDPRVRARAAEWVSNIGVPAITRIPGAIEELVTQLSSRSPKAVKLGLLERSDAAQMNVRRPAGAAPYAEGDPLMASPEYIRHLVNSRIRGDQMAPAKVGEIVDKALFGTARGRASVLPPHTLDRVTGEPLARRGTNIGYGTKEVIPGGFREYSGILDIEGSWPTLKTAFERLIRNRR